MTVEKIRKLLAVKLQEEAFQDCFLIEIKLHQNNKLAVFLDCDSGLTHGKCKQISRYLESTLDEKKWLGEHYILEVSSPGIGKPLQLKRQYHNNLGRKIEVTFPDGNTKTGLLKKVNDDSIIVEEKIKTKEGKKKKTELVQTEILFENIKKTMVLISF